MPNPSSPEPPIASLRVRAAILGSLAVVMSTLAWYTMLGAYPRTQQGDGMTFHKTIDAARVSVLRYHELPLWNPYECGGIPLWDNPQQVAAAPLAWPALIVGTTAAMYFWYVIHGAFGFLSMWLLCRYELRASWMAAFIGSCAWAFNGFHQHHYSGGHLAFVAFEYFPLAILLWRRAEADLRAAVGLGVLVAWMFYEGAVYPLPHLALFLGAETLTRAWPARRLLPIARAAAVVLVVGFVLGAARILPVLAQIRAHARELGVEGDVLRGKTFLRMFLARHHEREVPGQEYVWTEYNTYLGPIILVLALVGIALAGLRYAWIYALLALAVALMFGHFAHLAPWSILKGHVFPFKEMRVPSRFRCETSLFLAMFAAIGLDELREMIRSRTKSIEHATAAGTLLVALACIGVGDMLSVSLSWIETRFTNPSAGKVVPAAHLYYGGPRLATFIDQPQQNRGELDCWDEWGFSAGAPLWQGDLPQARGATSDVVVEAVNRTQNTFTMDVTAANAGRVLVNSAYDRGWRTDTGTLLEVDKQLVLELPAGRHHVRLHYWPHGLTLGFVLTLMGIAATTAYFVWERRRRRPISASA
ncbi:hypothetical protein [Pendulispora albinea]|uniref:YfhO family protein n=1 Tax=Pendulispora albinea TaxID=2741071 RepID=A0ABZ2LXF7_9BACT